MHTRAMARKMRHADRGKQSTDLQNQHIIPEPKHCNTSDTSKRVEQPCYTPLKLKTIASWADDDHNGEDVGVVAIADARQA